MMPIEIDKKKLLTGVVACIVVIGGVAAAERLDSVSQFLAPPTGSGQAAHAASSTPARAAKTQTAAASSAPTPQGKININTASADELMTLKGIGPAKAAAIIAYRTQSPFHQVDDISKVKGIGKVTFANIRNNITVGTVAP